MSKRSHSTKNAVLGKCTSIQRRNAYQKKCIQRKKYTHTVYTVYIMNTLFSTTTNTAAKMTPPYRRPYRAERHHHNHQMQHRNGVGRDSNFRNHGERRWNGDTGRVSFTTVLSDVVWARFFLSILTLTSFS